MMIFLWGEELLMREKDDPSVQVCVRLFGECCVEYRNEHGTWQIVKPSEWGGTTHARRLLGFLLLHGRRAGRGKLMEQLWPESDSFSLEGALNKAVSRVRKVLRADGLLSINSKRTTYQLADQLQVWADVEAYEAALQEAELYDAASLERSRLLAVAQGYFERGPLLDGEDDLWCHAKREGFETAYYRCLLGLAKAYEAQGLLRQAEAQLEKLLQRNPLDEVVLTHLMRLLQQQGLAAEAYRRSKNAVALFKKHSLSLSSNIEIFARDLQQSSQPVPETKPLADARIEANHVDVQHTIEPPILPKVEISHASLSQIGQGALYVLTEQQLLNFAAVCRLGEPTMFDSTKRQTLEALLATLSMAMVQPQGLLQREAWKPLLTSTTDIAKTNAETMQGLQSLIDACWQLSKGNELALAEKLLPVYLSKVVPLAQQPSPYQQKAINLAAQGFRLSGLLAFHRNNVQVQDLYYQQAAQYSRLSGDASLLISSLRSLGNLHYYGDQYSQALHAYQDALQHVKNVSPLQQASVYMSLAVAYAHMDQSQNALMYVGLAHDVFPDYPETDPSFSFAEFDRSQMILWEGIMCTRLGQTQQALAIFGCIEQPDFSASERLSIEIMNQRAKAAIFAGDVEQGVAYVKTGLVGAKALGSQRRYSEAYENFQQMRLLWPHEQRVTELGELLH
jgi:DNA-binding SARP family transcriptional activator